MWWFTFHSGESKSYIYDFPLTYYLFLFIFRGSKCSQHPPTNGARPSTWRKRTTPDPTPFPSTSRPSAAVLQSPVHPRSTMTRLVTRPKCGYSSKTETVYVGRRVLMVQRITCLAVPRRWLLTICRFESRVSHVIIKAKTGEKHGGVKEEKRYAWESIGCCFYLRNF